MGLSGVSIGQIDHLDIVDSDDEFLEKRFQLSPFPVAKTILGVWVDRAEKVRKKLALFLRAKDKEIAFTYIRAAE